MPPTSRPVDRSRPRGAASRRYSLRHRPDRRTHSGNSTPATTGRSTRRSHHRASCRRSSREMTARVASSSPSGCRTAPGRTARRRCRSPRRNWVPRSGPTDPQVGAPSGPAIRRRSGGARRPQRPTGGRSARWLAVTRRSTMMSMRRSTWMSKGTASSARGVQDSHRPARPIAPGRRKWQAASDRRRIDSSSSPCGDGARLPESTAKARASRMAAGRRANERRARSRRARGSRSR